MNKMDHNIQGQSLAPEKFKDPDWTAKGEERANVPPIGLKTLWINTGTICNLECVNCYIESTPKNDRLSFVTAAEVRSYLDEIEALDLKTEEIGITGGEPLINPHTPFIIADALAKDLRVLVLTNAMRPMLLPRNRNALLKINRKFGDRLTLRVSLDHFSAELHDKERGQGSFGIALEGITWLVDNGFKIDIAGRTCWGEAEGSERQGYHALFQERGIPVDAFDPGQLMLFPEMDEHVDVAEITVDCWNILGKDPADVMCASSRMVVKRKGADKPVVLPCTLLAYDTQFEMGETLSDAATVDGGAFRDGAVKLNHPHCAKFCVLGGGSCTA